MGTIINRTPPPAVGDKRMLVVSYALAMILAIMTVLQLVGFEAFTQYVAAYGFSAPEGSAIVAVLLLLLEISALPFLLRLWLSPLARCMSALCVLLIATVWNILLWQALARDLQLVNTGLLGGALPIPLGDFAAISGVGLLAAATWSFFALGGVKTCRLR